MRESWTDARLDDFKAETVRRFDRIDAELKGLNTRFDALNRTLMQIGGGVIVALIGVIMTQV